MKRALFGICGLGLMALAQSCVDDQSALYVVGLLAPDDECVFAEDADLVSLPSYDPLSVATGGPGYVATFLVQSQLLSRRSNISADPSGAVFTDADVTLLGIDGSPLGGISPNPFRMPAQGFVPPTEDGMPSAGFVKVVVIPAAIAGGLGGAPGVIVARVELHGHTTGTIDIDLEPYEFPIQILNLCGATSAGCLPGQDGASWCGPPE